MSKWSVRVLKICVIVAVVCVRLWRRRLAVALEVVAVLVAVVILGVCFGSKRPLGGWASWQECWEEEMSLKKLPSKKPDESLVGECC